MLRTRIPDLGNEKLFRRADNFVMNNDAIELTSSLECQSDWTHIGAPDPVLPPQVSEILLLHILIDELSTPIISATNAGE